MGLQLYDVRLFTLGIVTAFLSLFTGLYQTSITGLSSEVVRKFLNDSVQNQEGNMYSEHFMDFIMGLFVSCIYIFAMFGCLSASFLVHRFGPRLVVFLLNSCIAMTGCIFVISSKWTNLWQLLLVGRALFGINYGIALSVTPVYLTEFSSVKYRGFVGSLRALMSAIITFFGALMSTKLLLGTKDYWHVLMAFNGIPAFVQAVLFFFVPESPQFDYLVRKDGQSAMRTIQKYMHGYSSKSLDLIEKTFEDYDLQKARYDQQISFTQVLRNKLFLPTVVLALAVGTSRGFTGESVVNAYSKDILKTVGMDSHLIDYVGVGMKFTNIFTSAVGCILVESWGRRPLIIVTLMIIACSWTIVVIIQIIDRYFDTTWTPWLSLCSIIIGLVIAYPMGCSTVSHLVSAEICVQSVRTPISSLSMIGGTLNLFIIALLFPVVSSWSFSVAISVCFIVPLILDIILLYRRLPETKNCSIIDVVADVNKKAGRNFAV